MRVRVVGNYRGYRREEEGRAFFLVIDWCHHQDAEYRNGSDNCECPARSAKAPQPGFACVSDWNGLPLFPKTPGNPRAAPRHETESASAGDPMPTALSEIRDTVPGRVVFSVLMR